MIEKLKEFYSKNKKKCLTAGVLLIAGIVYCICGQEISVDAIVEKLCTLISCE